MKILERLIHKRIDLLNTCFDFGNYGVSKKSAKRELAILWLTVIVLGVLTHLVSSPSNYWELEKQKKPYCNQTLKLYH